MRREPPSFGRVAFGGVLLAATVTLGLVGCGSRGPLEADGLATNLTPPPDAASDDAAVPPDGATPRADAGPIQSAIACGGCVISTCREPITACLQDEACRSTFQCVVTTCLAGGSGMDPACLFKCASTAPGGAIGALAVFQCLTGSCGADCGPVLEGLGGLLGGAGGGRLSGAREQQVSIDAFRTVMAPWPDLMPPVDSR